MAPVTGAEVENMDVVNEEESSNGLDNKEVEPSSSVKMMTLKRFLASEQDLVYRCTFKLKPEMFQYLGSLMGYDEEGHPIAMRSPAFDADFGTQWVLSVSFDGWKGNQRWISVYLTRKDYRLTNVLGDLKLQCEFAVIGKGGRKLFKKESAIEDTFPGTSGGFFEFLPFKDLSAMLFDDFTLCIEATLKLIMLPKFSDHLDVQTGNPNSNANSDASTIYLADDVFDPEQFVEDRVHIEDSDRLALKICDMNICEYVSREKLTEKSKNYQKCLQLDFDCKTELCLLPITNDEKKMQKLMLDYADFINTGRCRPLETGSYHEISLLLALAKKMEVNELVLQCLSAMSLSITIETAAEHAILLNKYVSVIRNCDVYLNFLEYFQRNFEEIRKTSGFLSNVKTCSEIFTRAAFAPH